MYWAERRFGLRHRRIDALWNGHVKRHALRLAPGAVDLVHSGGQGRGAARRKRDPGAVAGEEAREMTAEAARTAGHQNVLISDFEHRRLPESV
jgi:hypothetical protein